MIFSKTQNCGQEVLGGDYFLKKVGIFYAFLDFWGFFEDI
jgi:hypothetical protein